MAATNVWQERIDKVLADPEAARTAAMLYYLVTSHVFGSCFHKRQCPERSLYEEAGRCVEHATKAAAEVKSNG